MRRVLLLAYLFPPVPNSGTRRSLTFANNLPDHGWEPLVLSWAPDAHARQEPEMLAEVRSGMTVERVALASRLRAERIARWLPSALQQRAADALAWRFKVRDAVPDEAAGWFKPAVEQALRMHQRHGFDAIYASGWPWTSFLVAREVSRQTGKPYVLDYRDCWISGGQHAWEHVSREQRDQAPEMQRTVAREAAALITTTRTFAQTIEEQLDSQVHLHVIPNGYEPSDFRALPPREPDGRLRLAYTGVWRPGYGLMDLYAAVSRLRDSGHPELNRLRLDSAGFAPGAAGRLGLAPWVTEHGLVPHARAVELMTGADVLYLPLPEGFQGKAALAGKHFEYLGSNRPILASAWPDSETARLAAEVGGVLRVDPGDVQALADLLARWLDAVAKGQAPDDFPRIRHEALRRYRRSETARELADVLTQAVDGSSGGGAL